MTMRLSSHVMVPSVGGVASVGLTLLGIHLLTAQSAGYWLGIGWGMAYAGFFSSVAAFRTASRNLANPFSSPTPTFTTLRVWWTTPKPYPNGSSFSPAESALYTGFAVVMMVLCVLALGWAGQTVADSVDHISKLKPCDSMGSCALPNR